MRSLGALLFLWVVWGYSASAQPELSNWRFGNRAGIEFSLNGPPTASAGSASIAFEACSAISDDSGHLLCYVNSTQVYDRTNLPFPNGTLRFGHFSATQGALLVPDPANKQQYYLFTVDAAENNLVNGLHYSIIDMRLRGGLGDIGPVKEVAVPLPAGQAKLTEKLAAVLLPNGRDYWIVVHGWESDAFDSFLLTAAGLQAVPVVSHVGAVHQSDSRPFDNAVGYLRVAPDTRRLAVARGKAGVELFDFDNATGQVTNALPIPVSATTFFYGLEFSADGSKLYLTNGEINGTVFQVDLANRFAVAAIGSVGTLAGSVLRGNDNRIYISEQASGHLSVINDPNAAGLACNFQSKALPLAPATYCVLGLPNFPSGLPSRLVLRVASESVCVNSPLRFEAAILPAAAGAVITWDFGDPPAGAANTASGSTARHTYMAAGTYQVTVRAILPDGRLLSAGQTLLVAPPPILSLGLRQLVLCTSQPLLIGPRDQPIGTTYRWHDGVTTAQREVLTAGRYVLTATSPQGCTAHDSVEVRAAQPTDDCSAIYLPNIITPNGDGHNDTFVLRGLVASDWDVVIYNRWGQEIYRKQRYDNSWDASGQSAGLYYYWLVSPLTSSHLRGWAEVVK